MRAVQCTQPGEAPVLAVAELPSPPLGPGQIRVAVHAAGINFADLLLVQGKYQEKPAPPFTPGMELAGTVVELGSDVSGFTPGDRVMAVAHLGGYADEAVVDAALAYRIPETMSFDAAAGFPIVYGTAHGGLTWRARLKPGETLLVNAAAGGVGLAAVEIGRLLGAKVIGTASTEEKLAIARQHGADHALLSGAPDLVDRIRAITGRGGVDVAFDPVGGPMFEACLRTIAWEGRIVIVGFAGGVVQQIPSNVALVKNCDVIGFFWGSYRTRDPARLRESLEAALAWVADGRLTPHVSATFSLEQVTEAFAALSSRRSTGKLVLTTGR
ncbi:MAG TPA: NADPH:quinone oxidoreductase family protein [Stellaceae bacterium]|nr:NADPH:quinone oxidoreductase family protein [Stellaceae bacterium]